MRDRIARLALFAFGVFGIGAGVLTFFGFSDLESRWTVILVAVGAIAGGISMVLRSRGPNPRLGRQGTAPSA